jgi:hypothetical protein
LPENHAVGVGVGVDRFDYTKGIEERLRAVEQLLERAPEWIGRFTFVQIAAPTRAGIEEYDQYQARVGSLVERINVLNPLIRRSSCWLPITSRPRSMSTTAPPTSAWSPAFTTA